MSGAGLCREVAGESSDKAAEEGGERVLRHGPNTLITVEEPKKSGGKKRYDEKG